VANKIRQTDRTHNKVTLELERRRILKAERILKAATTTTANNLATQWAKTHVECQPTTILTRECKTPAVTTGKVTTEGPIKADTTRWRAGKVVIPCKIIWAVKTQGTKVATKIHRVTRAETRVGIKVHKEAHRVASRKVVRVVQEEVRVNNLRFKRIILIW